MQRCRFHYSIPSNHTQRKTSIRSDVVLPENANVSESIQRGDFAGTIVRESLAVDLKRNFCNGSSDC